MRSLATTRFWKLYGQLPEAIRDWADKCYKLWQKDRRHPSLRFKIVKGGQELYSISIGLHYRAVGRVKGDVVQWIWIGSHEEYNRLISQR